MGFECTRHPPILEDEPAGRPAPVGSGLGARALRIEPAIFRHGESTGRARRHGLENRWHVKRRVWIKTTALRHSLRVKVWRPARSHKPAQQSSILGPATILGSAIRTGWCRRRAVNAVPTGKRFDSVHFPPCDRSSMAARLVATQLTMGSLPPG